MAVLLQDDFSEANGTEINGKALDVGAVNWTAEGGNGNWSVQSGALVTGTGQGVGNDYCYADAGVADVVVTVPVTLPASPADAHYGVVGRVQDGDNSWIIAIYEQGDSFRLFENVANGFTLRDSKSVTINGGTTYTIVVTFSGNNITATLDGGNQLSYTSTTFNTQTKFGIYGANSISVAEFLVESVAGGGATYPGADGCGVF